MTCLAPLRLHRINGLSNRTIGCGHAESGRDRTGLNIHGCEGALEAIQAIEHLGQWKVVPWLQSFKRLISRTSLKGRTAYIFGALEHRIQHSMQLGRCNISDLVRHQRKFVGWDIDPVRRVLPNLDPPQVTKMTHKFSGKFLKVEASSELCFDQLQCGLTIFIQNCIDQVPEGCAVRDAQHFPCLAFGDCESAVRDHLIQ